MRSSSEEGGKGEGIGWLDLWRGHYLSELTNPTSSPFILPYLSPMTPCYEFHLAYKALFLPLPILMQSSSHSSVRAAGRVLREKK